MTDTIVFNVVAPRIAVKELKGREDLYDILIDIEYGRLTFPQVDKKSSNSFAQPYEPTYEIAFDHEQNMLEIRYDNGPAFSDSTRYTARGFAGKGDFLVWEDQTGVAAIVSGYKTDGIFTASMIPAFLLQNVAISATN